MTNVTFQRLWDERMELFGKVSQDEKLLEQCHRLVDILCLTIKESGNIFTCGNGGSMCDAMHLAEELTGRFMKNRRPLGALALGDAGHISCVANDFGYDQIFARQLGGLGRRGDLLLAFSTSGKSKNLIEAFKVADELGVKKVALLGRGGGDLKALADVAIVVPGDLPHLVQEVHIKLVHIFIELVERRLFPELW